MADWFSGRSAHQPRRWRTSRNAFLDANVRPSTMRDVFPAIISYDFRYANSFTSFSGIPRVSG